MTHEEIQRHLAELEKQRINVLKALKQRQEQGKYDLAQTIKDMIAEQGYVLDEIVPLLAAKKRRTPTRRQTLAEPVPVAAASPQGAYYFDPENAANIYVKGAIPTWMKQKMLDQGLDPKNKDDRNAFKARFLKRFEG